MSNGELLDVYDANGVFQYRTHVRGAPVPVGDHHRCVHIWVRGPKGTYLIQQRAPTVESSPGIWATTAGAVRAGETPLDAAVRETVEEVGLTIEPSQFEPLFESKDHLIAAVWLVQLMEEPVGLSPQPEEVSAIRWSSQAEIEEMIRAGTFLGYGTAYFAQVFSGAIRLVRHNPQWGARFERERVHLAEILRPWLTGPIEHIGSTAVPGLSAKPVIDLMAGVKGLEASREAIGAVERAGYLYAPYRPEVEHWFCKPSPDFRTHHLHLVPYGSESWEACILFRDALRQDLKLAADYLALKQGLADSVGNDREAYTEGKRSFIERVVREAKDDIARRKLR